MVTWQDKEFYEGEFGDQFYNRGVYSRDIDEKEAAQQKVLESNIELAKGGDLDALKMCRTFKQTLGLSDVDLNNLREDYMTALGLR